MEIINEFVALLQGFSEYIAWLIATIVEALSLFGV